MLIENKDLKPLIEMTDEEIVAIVRGGEHVERFVNKIAGWATVKTILQRDDIYRLIPKYTPITVDWSVLDNSIQWIDADEDGAIFGYGEEPYKCNYHWRCDGYFVLISGLKSLNRGTIPWDQSLIKRPDGM